MPARDSRPLILVLLVVVGVGLLLSGIPAPASATDFSRGGDRLIVLWRQAAPSGVVLPGVARMVTARNSRRSVVVAEPGRAALAAAGLGSDRRVAAVVPDVRVSAADWPSSGTPNDPGYAAGQHDLSLIGMASAWPVTTGDPSVIVAVLDSGMDPGNPDLAGVRTVSAWNFVDGTADTTDRFGHGSHVTGTIAATTNNGVGVAGIAPGVTIMPLKVLDDTGSGYFSDILNGIDYARTSGAKVISLSLTGTLDTATAQALQPTVDAAYQAGITIVAAAGNDGTSLLEYPCAFAHVVCVAATDNADAHAAFSNANAAVDISAPGVSILSTYPGSRFVNMSGTSMATPHVAGVAALVRSAHPQDTVDEVGQALVATAVDLGPAGRDDVFGYGRVDAAAAVAWTPAPTPTPTPVPTPTPTPVPTPTPTPATAGQAAGSGVVGTGTKAVKFQFSVKSDGTRSEGSLTLTGRGVALRTSTIRTFDRTGSQATWTGVAKWNGHTGFTYLAKAVDNRVSTNDRGARRPEATVTRDRLEVTVRNAAGKTVYTVAASIASGNIVVSAYHSGDGHESDRLWSRSIRSL